MKRYFNLVRIGIAFGTIFGAVHAWRAGQFVFSPGTYRTLLLTTILEIDKWPIALAAILSIVCVSYTVYARFAKQSSEMDEDNAKVARFLLRIEDGLADRRIFLSVFGLLLLANAVGGILRFQETLIRQNRPNIIFIMVDTLRADHLKCYGYTRDTTPNIDRFAAGSIRFKRAISQAPATKWSVPSFLTSEYPQDREKAFRPNLAQILRKNGYTTAGIISNPMVDELPGMNVGWDHWDPSMGARDSSSQGILRNSLRWLDKLPKDRKQPFFLFTLFMDPHSPYIAQKGHVFDPDYSGPGKDKADFSPRAEDTRVTAPCSVDHLKALYDSDIAYTDAAIGDFLTGLKKRGLYDKSLIVFLADHGEEFHDHGDFFHAKTLYNELLSVPLIVKLPSQKEGRVVDGGAFSLIDLAPSVLNCIGINPAALSPQGCAVDFQKTNTLPDRPIFSATRPHLRSVQNSRYALIEGVTPYSKNPVSELYDIVADPHQHHNLLPGMRKISVTLHKEIASNEDSTVADIVAVRMLQANGKLHKDRPMPKPGMDDRIRSLGYLGK